MALTQGIKTNGKDIFPEKKRGIIELNEEGTKEASKDMEEKGVKTSHLKQLAELGVKLPNDQPCFPIPVNVISTTKCNEKVTSFTEVSYENDFAYHHDPEEHNIRMMIMENSHKIKFLHESLHVNVEEVKKLLNILR